MDDLDYIKEFSKINISSVCRELNINRSNLLNGTSKKIYAKKVRKNLEDKVARLYLLNKEVEDGKNNSL